MTGGGEEGAGIVVLEIQEIWDKRQSIKVL